MVLSTLSRLLSTRSSVATCSREELDFLAMPAPRRVPIVLSCESVDAADRRCSSTSTAGLFDKCSTGSANRVSGTVESAGKVKAKGRNPESCVTTATASGRSSRRGASLCIASEKVQGWRRVQGVFFLTKWGGVYYTHHSDA